MRGAIARDRVESDKAVAEAKKAGAATWKDRIDSIRTAGIAFSVLYGVLAVFGYCFFVAKFIPSGVSAGDTLLFTFIAMALGTTGFVLAALGVTVWFPLTLPIEGERERSWPKVLWGLIAFYVAVCLAHIGLIKLATRPVSPSKSISQIWPFDLEFAKSWLDPIYAEINSHFFPFVGLSWLVFAVAAGAILWWRGASKMVFAGTGCICGLVLLLVLQLAQIPQGQWILLGAIVGGEFLAFAMMPSTNSSGKRQLMGQKLAFALIAMVLPVFFIVVFQDRDSKVGIASLVFGNFGIYADDAAMEVSSGNLQTLVAAAELQGNSLDVCRGTDGTAIVTGLKVWWHGIGNRSHVEIPRLGGRGIVVDLDTAQAKLIRNNQSRCIDLPGTYFDSGSDRLTDLGQKRLLEAVKRWTQRGITQPCLVQMTIIGHADPMTPAGKKTNQGLSLGRAQAVADALHASGLLNSFFDQPQAALSEALVIEADAARSPLKDCPRTLSTAERRECNEVNRRVELRLRFAPDDRPAIAASKAASS